jgi:hypothetical protein
MHAKREWFWFFLIIGLLVFVLFNLKFLGFAVVNTTSNVTIIGANNPPVIGGLNDTLSVCENDNLFYLFYATDLDGNALTGTINPQNPFFLFWMAQSSPNNNTFAIVSGRLDKSKVGGANVGFKLYPETISVSDGYSTSCCTDSKKINITVIEINNAPSVENIGVHTVWNNGDNSTFYKAWSVSDIESGWGYGSLFFNITILNSTGSIVNLFNISSAGIINFTADNQTALGVYNVSVCVNDTGLTNVHPKIFEYCGQNGEAISICNNFSLTVTNQNRQPEFLNYYPGNLSPIFSEVSDLYFNITTYDPDKTIPDVYWYVDGNLQQYHSGLSFDEFKYNLACGTSGILHVESVITDGLLNNSLIWNVTYSTPACPNPSTGGGSGGGGGGGVAAPTTFKVEPDFITTTILQQDGKSFDIKVTNLGTQSIHVSSIIQNLSQIAILNEDNFTIEAGKEKIIRLYLYALSETKTGVYFGSILFSAGGTQRAVKIVVEVKERSPLFDLKVIVPTQYKAVNPGQDIKVLVNMMNIGLYGTPVDVELYLYITDLNKIISYESAKEIISVKTNLSVERTLHVPIGASAGTYLVLGEARYTNITVTTYDTFNVVEKKYLNASLFLIILGIIVLIFLILLLLYKRRKKKKEQS